MNRKVCLGMALFFVAFQSGCTYTESNNALLERSIGKLVLMSDSVHSYEHNFSSFGDLKTAHEAALIYEKHIRHLPRKSRVDYFWALMWHFDFFFTSEFPTFAPLILRDCGADFLKRLEDYIEREEDAQRNNFNLRNTKQVLLQLKRYQDSEEWKRLQSKKNFNGPPDR